jgi:glycosyltransferase involved in cell wall biosynthesis
VNVLISSGFRWWNAEAAYAATLGVLLREAGHGVWVIAPVSTRNADELARRGLELVMDIRPGYRNPLRWPAEAARLIAFQRSRRIEVVNVFRSADFLLHAWAARRAPGLRLIRTRGGAQPERGTWLNRKQYGAWCDGVIASCDAIRRRLRSRLGVPEERIRTIYYPVDLPPLRGEEARGAARERLLRELGLAPDPLLMAVVGRIAPEKGHEPLLEAFQSVARAVPRALLLILNKAYPSESPHRERLERSIRARGLEPFVRWLGFREDVREVMAACDLGVIPSLTSEMNCRVAVEFLSVATPVVAFPTGALPEVVEHDVSGLIARSHRPEDLAEPLIRLASDPALRARLGQGARRQAERRFSRELFLRQTLEVFAPQGWST